MDLIVHIMEDDPVTIRTVSVPTFNSHTCLGIVLAIVCQDLLRFITVVKDYSSTPLTIHPITDTKLTQ